MAHPFPTPLGRFLQSLSAAAFCCGGLLAADVEVVGKVKVELYAGGGFVGTRGNLPGSTIADLTASPSFPAVPSAVVYSPLAEFPYNEDPASVAGAFRAAPADDVYNDYGVRMSGYLQPPTTGTWYFYLASAGQGQLWVSRDADPANKQLVAQETAWGNRRYYFNLERDFPGLPPELLGLGGDQRDDAQTGAITADGRYQTRNVSDGIPLVQGRKYYFEALMKAGVGKDNLSVWATRDPNPLPTLLTDYPDYPEPALASGGPVPLSGDWISTTGPERTTLVASPQDVAVTAGLPFRFEVKVVPGINAGRLSYRWFQDDVEVLLPGGQPVDRPVLDSLALGYDPVRLAELSDDQTHWKVQVTPENGEPVVSAVATLTVTPDVVPPQVVRVTPTDTSTSLLVQFDSPLAPAGVTAGNFTLDGVAVATARLLNPSRVENSRVLLLVTNNLPGNALLTLGVGPEVTDRAGLPVTPATNQFRTLGRVAGVANYLRFENETLPGTLENLRAFRDGDRVAAGAVDAAEVVTQFAHPATSPDVDNFLGMLRGWVTPPETGDYEFFLASDEAGILWLSTDDTAANLKAIAVEPGSAAFGDFLGSTGEGTVDRVIRLGDGDATPKNVGGLRNRSGVYPGSEWPSGPGPIRLEAGRRYRMVALHKDLSGVDGIAVGVKRFEGPDATVSVLPGSWLEGLSDGAPVVTSRVLVVTSVEAGVLRLEWTGNARLASAPTLDGPFEPVAGASSPYTPSTAGAARFYRLLP